MYIHPQCATSATYTSIQIRAEPYPNMYEYINYIMIHSYKLHTYNPSRERAQGDLGSPLRIQPTLGNLWYKTDKLKDDKVLA